MNRIDVDLGEELRRMGRASLNGRTIDPGLYAPETDLPKIDLFGSYRRTTRGRRDKRLR